MRFTSTLALAATSLAASAIAASSCNGDASLCQRLYSNVTYIGAHDSYAVGTGAADNQAKDVTAQLVSPTRLGRDGGSRGRARDTCPVAKKLGRLGDGLGLGLFETQRRDQRQKYELARTPASTWPGRYSLRRHNANNRRRMASERSRSRPT